ncbi:helix-turn-helix domain-containing protein [Streptomyces sp. NPDC017949]|uniref:helix-turn-helix domain-containing protein n=1 Tax=Streptomyces sp. NPDC017949 TaxID=3365020 RepID=UPI00379CC119
MAFQHPSAPSPASSRVPAGTIRSGVVHVNTQHTTHYTVVGNHLAQHRELSLTAIGLALHIQSLPTGARVGIQALAGRFPEGESRIATALRELEAHGYLERSRVRIGDGRIVTRTVSYNHPKGTPPPPPPPPGDRAPVADPAEPTTVPKPDPQPAAGPLPQPAPGPAREEPEPEPASGPQPASDLRPAPRSESAPEPVPEPDLSPASDPDPGPEAGGPRWREAEALLARLREDDHRLLLSESSVRQLAPGVADWLHRGAAPEAVRMVLAADLPPTCGTRPPCSATDSGRPGRHGSRPFRPPPLRPRGPTRCRTATAATAASAPPPRAAARTARPSMRPWRPPEEPLVLKCA